MQRGDTIAVVATSWGGPAALPERLERGVAALTELGYRVRSMPNALRAGDGARSWVSASREARLDDLHRAFSDPEVRCVLSAIGGNHCADLLDGLDFDLVRANPKVVCGYSDTTSLLLAINAVTGLVTFYGPALLPEFGEVGGPDREVVDWFERVVGGTSPPGRLPRVGWQATENRAVTDAEARPRSRGAPEPRLLLRPGEATGPLLAACLPSLRNLLGTPWQPDFRGRILVLETPEAPYDPAWADADLTHLRNAGALAGLAGLVIGRTDGWTAEQRDALRGCVLDAARGEDYPVLAGIECSHAAPMLVLPLGVQASVSETDLVVDESAVA